MDNVDRATRSRVMFSVKSKNTRPELYFRKLLFHRGFRYTLHNSKITGRPDLYLKKYNTAVFVNGCFWHRHPDPDCKLTRTPKSRVDYWNDKFNKNIERDKRNSDELKKQGIKKLVIWECTIKKMMKDKTYEQKIMDEVVNFLKNNKMDIDL